MLPGLGYGYLGKWWGIMIFQIDITVTVWLFRYEGEGNTYTLLFPVDSSSPCTHGTSPKKCRGLDAGRSMKEQRNHAIFTLAARDFAQPGQSIFFFRSSSSRVSGAEHDAFGVVDGEPEKVPDFMGSFFCNPVIEIIALSRRP